MSEQRRLSRWIICGRPVCFRDLYEASATTTWDVPIVSASFGATARRDMSRSTCRFVSALRKDHELARAEYSSRTSPLALESCRVLIVTSYQALASIARRILGHADMDLLTRPYRLLRGSSRRLARSEKFTRIVSDPTYGRCHFIGLSLEFAHAV